MCSTFLIAAAQIKGRALIVDDFVVVTMRALPPILSTLVLGYIYKRKDEKDRKEKQK